MKIFHVDWPIAADHRISGGVEDEDTQRQNEAKQARPVGHLAPRWWIGINSKQVPKKFRKTGDLRFSAAIVEKLLTICKDEKLVWSVGPFNKTWFACQAQLRNETLRFLQVGHK